MTLGHKNVFWLKQQPTTLKTAQEQTTGARKGKWTFEQYKNKEKEK